VNQINGYCVVTLRAPVAGASGSYVLVQYGLPLASLNADIAQLDILLNSRRPGGHRDGLRSRLASSPGGRSHRSPSLTAAAGEIERTR